MKKIIYLICLILLFTGCSFTHKEETPDEQKEPSPSHNAREDSIEPESESELEIQTEPQTETPEQAETKPQKKPQTIVLDPGHSAVIAPGTEPLGPGSQEYKSADAGGTCGVSTGIPEYELTLNISLQLKQELENRGYTVLLTRESNDVPVSCIQRADVANNAKAAAFVRIHANGSEDQSVTGAMTICTTPQSPYVPELYTASRQLSDCILNSFCAATDCTNSTVWETDSMSGNNWSQVPATIVEMGYMSNPQEDVLLQTPDYQQKIVQGIANGIDSFCGY